MLVVTSLDGCHACCCQVASLLLNVEGFQSYCRKPCSHLHLEQALLPSLLVLRSSRESMVFQRLSFPKLLLWKNWDLLHLRLVIKYSICGTEPHGLARVGSMHHRGRCKWLLCCIGPPYIMLLLCSVAKLCLTL